MKKFLLCVFFQLLSMQGIQLFGQDSTELHADFLSDLSEACAPVEVVFQNNSTGMDSCSWSFGDGSPVCTDDSLSLSHTFTNTGASTLVYPVQLIVYGEEGLSDTVMHEITIHPEISASFEMVALVKISDGPGGTCSFFNASTAFFKKFSSSIRNLTYTL